VRAAFRSDVSRERTRRSNVKSAAREVPATIEIRFTTFVRRRFKFSAHNRAAWSAAQATAGCAGSQRDGATRERCNHSPALRWTPRSDPVSALFAFGTTQPERSRISRFLTKHRGLNLTTMRDNPRTTGRLARRIHAALDAAVACASEPARSAQARKRRKLGHLCAIACTLAISGCAGSAPQPDSRSEPNHPGAASLSGQETSPKCHIARALLVSPPAPDCGFGRSDLKTMDPDQWARLKLEFERKCFQHAEKSVRERLRQLQTAANRCGVEQASRWAKS
jgi:hypothetical protein